MNRWNVVSLAVVALLVASLLWTLDAGYLVIGSTSAGTTVMISEMSFLRAALALLAISASGRAEAVA